MSSQVLRVTISRTKSGWRPLSSSMPEGSVLGPAQFNTFINKLNDGMACTLAKFTDEMKLKEQLTHWRAGQPTKGTLIGQRGGLTRTTQSLRRRMPQRQKQPQAPGHAGCQPTKKQFSREVLKCPSKHQVEHELSKAPSTHPLHVPHFPLLVQLLEKKAEIQNRAPMCSLLLTHSATAMFLHSNSALNQNQKISSIMKCFCQLVHQLGIDLSEETKIIQ